MSDGESIRLTNCERIGRAFDVLKPYLDARLRRELAGAPGTRIPPSADLLALLKVLLEHWNGRLAGSFPPQTKQYAHLLRDVRNRCAHGVPLADREARHALDTLSLLAAVIEAPPAALDALDTLASQGEALTRISSSRPVAASDRGRDWRRAPSDAATAMPAYESGVIVNAAELTADDVAMRRVLCPACQVKVFEEWSAGWDAHAGSPTACRGLTSVGAQVRKAEFRTRFGHLFRTSGRTAAQSQRAVMKRIWAEAGQSPTGKRIA